MTVSAEKKKQVLVAFNGVLMVARLVSSGKKISTIEIDYGTSCFRFRVPVHAVMELQP